MTLAISQHRQGRTKKKIYDKDTLSASPLASSSWTTPAPVRYSKRSATTLSTTADRGFWWSTWSPAWASLSLASWHPGILGPEQSVSWVETERLVCRWETRRAFSGVKFQTWSSVWGWRRCSRAWFPSRSRFRTARFWKKVLAWWCRCYKTFAHFVTDGGGNWARAFVPGKFNLFYFLQGRPCSCEEHLTAPLCMSRLQALPANIRPDRKKCFGQTFKLVLPQRQWRIKVYNIDTWPVWLASAAVLRLCVSVATGCPQFPVCKSSGPPFGGCSCEGWAAIQGQVGASSCCATTPRTPTKKKLRKRLQSGTMYFMTQLCWTITSLSC